MAEIDGRRPIRWRRDRAPARHRRPANGTSGCPRARCANRPPSRPGDHPRLHRRAVQGGHPRLPGLDRRAVRHHAGLRPLLKLGRRAARPTRSSPGGPAHVARARRSRARSGDDLAAKLEQFAPEKAKHTTPYFRTPAVKLFVDGVIEGHTGYLEEPYADAEEYAGDPKYRGTPLWEPERSRRASRRSTRPASRSTSTPSATRRRARSSTPSTRQARERRARLASGRSPTSSSSAPTTSPASPTSASSPSRSPTGSSRTTTTRTCRCPTSASRAPTRNTR